MEQAVPRRAPWAGARPSGVVERWIQTETGLLVARERDDAELEIFRTGALPPKRRLLKKDIPVPIVDQGPDALDDR
jgi:hypothetical protein